MLLLVLSVAGFGEIFGEGIWHRMLRREQKQCLLSRISHQ